MPNQEIGFKRVRMIVVERCPLLESKIVPIAVIAVGLKEGDLVVSDALDDAPDDRRLSRGGSAGDTNNQWCRAPRVCLAHVVHLAAAYHFTMLHVRAHLPSVLCVRRRTSARG